MPLYILARPTLTCAQLVQPALAVFDSSCSTDCTWFKAFIFSYFTFHKPPFAWMFVYKPTFFCALIIISVTLSLSYNRTISVKAWSASAPHVTVLFSKELHWWAALQALQYKTCAYLTLGISLYTVKKSSSFFNPGSGKTSGWMWFRAFEFSYRMRMSLLYITKLGVNITVLRTQILDWQPYSISVWTRPFLCLSTQC